jgi:hypothetical protein
MQITHQGMAQANGDIIFGSLCPLFFHKTVRQSVFWARCKVVGVCDPAVWQLCLQPWSVTSPSSCLTHRRITTPHHVAAMCRSPPPPSATASPPPPLASLIAQGRDGTPTASLHPAASTAATLTPFDCCSATPHHHVMPWGQPTAGPHAPHKDLSLQKGLSYRGMEATTGPFTLTLLPD